MNNLNRILECLFIACFVITIAACGSKTKPICDPGGTQECLCSGGGKGAQTCNTEGTAWGTCSCNSTAHDAGNDQTIAEDSALQPDAAHQPDTALQPDVAHQPDTALQQDAAPGPCEATTVTPHCNNGFCTIPPGSFQMGSPSNEPCRESTRETQHQITLTGCFEISETETTQSQFQTQMGYNPAHHQTNCGTTCPVEVVTWHQSVAYCNKLSEQAGLGTCYSCTGTGDQIQCSTSATYSGSGKTIYDCPGYRLPTDAEWEYAYRAKTTTAFYNGPIASCTGSDAKADQIGWHKGNASGTTHPVKQKLPNGWGLYDMSGNVMEHTHDFFTENLGTSSAADPVGSKSDASTVIRGGSFSHDAPWGRAAARGKATGNATSTATGFRCARTL